MPSFEFEEKHYTEGYTAVCGCDEAGRGPLCGPVVAAAVIVPLGIEIEGLNDSKKLSEKKREQLFDVIKEKAVAYAIAEATPAEIDEINILNASMLAMQRAVEALSLYCGGKCVVLIECEAECTGFQSCFRKILVQFLLYLCRCRSCSRSFQDIFTFKLYCRSCIVPGAFDVTL